MRSACGERCNASGRRGYVVASTLAPFSPEVLIPTLTRGQRIQFLVTAILAIATGVLAYAEATPIVRFVVSAAALSMLATVVGLGTDQLASRFGPGATGMLQSAFGNLPELFVCFFSLRAGLVGVVQAALVGAILANSLLVLGLAIFFGGWRHGTQRFASEPPRMVASLMLVAVSALTIPTVAHQLHTPAEPHEAALSAACAIALLVVFASSIPFSLRGDPAVAPVHPVDHEHPPWPLWLALTALAGAGLGAAAVSEWFVDAMLPATQALGLSEAFTGLVIVAIAGNAVENIVGIKLAAQNKSDYAMSVILNSSLMIALLLTPVLVLSSFFIGPTPLTLVLSPLLVVALALSAIVSTVIVYDGESIWVEGVALVGLYVIIAAAFWWG